MHGLEGTLRALSPCRRVTSSPGLNVRLFPGSHGSQMHRSDLCLTRPFPACLSLCLSRSYKVTHVEGEPAQGPHLNLVTSEKTDSQTRSESQSQDLSMLFLRGCDSALTVSQVPSSAPCPLRCQGCRPSLGLLRSRETKCTDSSHTITHRAGLGLATGIFLTRISQRCFQTEAEASEVRREELDGEMAKAVCPCGRQKAGRGGKVEKEARTRAGGVHPQLVAGCGTKGRHAGSRLRAWPTQGPVGKKTAASRA